ncbi:MAG: hypothetical protein ABIO70_18095 [Pseudomonadota bacterium]
MAASPHPDPITAVFAGLTGAAALLVLITAATALSGTGEDARLAALSSTRSSKDITALRAEQGALLRGCRPLPDGRVAIPIERAMEVVLPELKASEVVLPESEAPAGG